MKRLIKWSLIAGLLWVLLLFLGGLSRPLGSLISLLPFGWVRFLGRHWVEATFNWGMLLTGLFVSVAICTTGHWLLKALHRQAQQGNAEGTARTWQWRWTLALFTSFCLLFVIAIGATGLFRQTTWLAQYPEHWYQERLNSYSELRRASGNVEMLFFDTERDIEKVHQAYLNARSDFFRDPFFEDWNLILYASADGQVRAHVVVPRNPKLLKAGRFICSGTNDFVSLTNLEATIQKLDQQYPIKR